MAKVPNKIVFGSDTLIDLTADTVTADKLATGYTAHDASGAQITGTYEDALVDLNLSGFTQTTFASNAMQDKFKDCKGIKSVDLSGLTEINGGYAFQRCFQNCPNLTSVNLSGLTKISGTYAAADLFMQSSGITAISLPALKEISGSYAATGFVYATGITTITFPVLDTLTGSRCMNSFVAYCANLTDVYFPALKSTTMPSSSTRPFSDLLLGDTGVTVHFPSNMQSVIGSWSDVTSGFSGTNTTVLWDLPATE